MAKTNPGIFNSKSFCSLDYGGLDQGNYLDLDVFISQSLSFIFYETVKASSKKSGETRFKTGPL